MRAGDDECSEVLLVVLVFALCDNVLCLVGGDVRVGRAEFQVDDQPTCGHV